MSRTGYSLILVLLILSGGCRHREICDPAAMARDIPVRIDWSEAPEREVKGMTCYFYPSGSKSGIRFDLETVDRGMVRLAPGRYRVVAFNNRSDVLLHRGEGAYETIESYTGRGNTLSGSLKSLRGPRGFEGRDIRLSPDPFYSGRIEELEITREMPREIVLRPRAHYIDIDISLDRIIRSESLAGLSGALSGASPGYLMGEERLASGSVSHPFSLRKSGEGQAEGQMRCYGFSPDAERYEITLFAVLKDGRGLYFTFDVTDQVREKLPSGTDEIHISLTIDTPIELPKLEKPESSGGIVVRVERWDKIYVDLPMTSTQ